LSAGSLEQPTRDRLVAADLLSQHRTSRHHEFRQS
jgi:hypothetical protein